MTKKTKIMIKIKIKNFFHAISLYWLLAMIMTVSLCAEDRHIENYLKFLSEYKDTLGKKGNFKENEIEIVLEPSKILEIEKLQKARCLRQGMSEEAAVRASKMGVIAEDSYWVILRDAVIFPTGAEGAYNRVLLKKGLDDGVPGVAVLPILEGGKIGAIIAFRHATRSFELELPRGFKQANETIDQALKRELEEETGFHAKEMLFLGNVTPDPGITSAVTPVYAAKVEKYGLPNQDYSEAIFGVRTFTLSEMKEAFVKGYFEIDIKGKKEKVFVRDSYLVYAVFLAESRKIIALEKG